MIDRCSDQNGFTLIEATLMLALVSLMFVLALPRSSTTSGTASMRIKAFEIVAVLRADRDESIRTGRPVMSFVDPAVGQVRSGVENGVVSLPVNLAMRASGQAVPGIRFMPDGTTSGGEIFLARSDGSGLIAVRVNLLTAAITIDRSTPDGR